MSHGLAPGKNAGTVDALVFLGPHIAGGGLDVEAVLDSADAAGVGLTVLAPAKPREYHLAQANEAVAAAVAARPDRFHGLGRVDPLRGDDAVGLAERCLDELGLQGLLLHPWEETFPVDDERVDRVVEVAEMRGVPVTVMAGYPWLSEALQVGALAERHPTVTFLLSNGAQYNISGLGMQDAWAALEAQPNLVVHTSGVYRQDFIEDVATRLGPDRILFASGAPQYDSRFEILRVRWAALPDATIAAMLGGTWWRLVATR